MSNNLKNSFKKAAFVLVYIFGFSTVYGQFSIQGEVNVNQGESYTYTISGGNASFLTWMVPIGGSITSQNNSSAIVNWTGSGEGIIAAGGQDYFSNSIDVALHVVITGTNPPVPPSPTVQSSACGTITLERTGTPAPGTGWYWQDSETGESTVNSASTITLTSGTVHYLRAKYNSGLWSTTSSSVSFTAPEIPIWYADTDGDGFGDPAVTESNCDQPQGYVDNNTDQCPNLSGTAANNGCPEGALGNENYIYTIQPQIPLGVITPETPIESLIESITYFDGLGRPKQQIAIRQSPLGDDMITHIGYDDYGRQAKDFLPYAITSTGGTFRADALDATLVFYDVAKYENTTNPFSEKHFEASPLNRVLEQGAPGEDWAVDKTSDIDHTIKFDYQSNTTDEVILYKVLFVDLQNIEVPSLVQEEFYAANELYKSIVKDENWEAGQDHTTEEFKDKQGRVVLKRTYNNNTAHNTYYVYDDFGNLTYVIPPKAADESTINQNTLDELCYQYKYDYRNRLIEKKIPGKGLESIVYDKLDRPVLTQDAIQKTNNQWLFTKYDVFGRVVYTGILSNETRNRASIQEDEFNIKTAVQNYEAKVDSPATGYDNTHYTNTNFPDVNIEVLTVNYYDNYAFSSAPFNPVSNPIQVFDKETIGNTKTLATGSKIKVLDTATAKWINTTTYYDDKAQPIYSYSQNEFLATIDIIKTDLDFVGKVLKTRTSHKRGSEEEIVTVDTFTYDHVGRLLKQVQCIGGTDLENTCGDEGSTGQQSTITTTEVIDTSISKSIIASQSITLLPGFHAKPDAGQHVEIKIDANGPGASGQAELIVENSYDALGQLKTKRVGNSETAALQTIDYTYNIRGWLKNINQDSEDDNDLFNFTLMYNDITDTDKQLFNGNISQTSWSTLTENTTANPKSTAYTYTYDALNRITSGIDNTNNYNLSSVAYDKNGNITNLERKGHTDIDVTSFGVMDNLVYDYDSGNKLLKVSDTSGKVQGFKDGTNGDDDYTYDPNGNLTLDKNKGITNIIYNHLNLPTKVEFGSSNNIQYKYDATGVKLKKVVNDGGVSTTTDYTANGSVYENDILQFIPHAEGYYNVNSFSLGVLEGSYVYQYKDHLGNIRLSYSDSDNNGTITISEIIEENNYYPFGLKHKGYNFNVSANGNSVAQRFKFGGKEYDESFNGTLNTYDFGARNYNPALGRWMNLDPLGELMMTYSPYNYAFDNPVYYSDPSGLAPWSNGDEFDASSRRYIDDTGQNFTGYVRDDNDNVYFDPKANRDTVLPPGYVYEGDTYISPTGVYWDKNGVPHGESSTVLEEVVVVGKSRKSKKKASLVRSWGVGTSDGGPRGIGSGELNYDDFGPTSPFKLNFLNLWRYIRLNLGLRSRTKRVIKRFSKKSTMENKVEEEAKNVPKKIKVLTIEKIIPGYGGRISPRVPVTEKDSAVEDKDIQFILKRNSKIRSLKDSIENN